MHRFDVSPGVLASLCSVGSIQSLYGKTVTDSSCSFFVHAFAPDWIGPRPAFERKGTEVHSGSM
jgi:hypothetical protein